jgi:hypothetical protein
MKEARRSSETSVHTRATLRSIPEDTILHSHCRGNLKSYIFNHSLLCRRKDVNSSIWYVEIWKFPNNLFSFKGNQSYVGFQSLHVLHTQLHPGEHGIWKSCNTALRLSIASKISSMWFKWILLWVEPPTSNSTSDILKHLLMAGDSQHKAEKNDRNEICDVLGFTSTSSGSVMKTCGNPRAHNRNVGPYSLYSWRNCFESPGNVTWVCRDSGYVQNTRCFFNIRCFKSFESILLLKETVRIFHRYFCKVGEFIFLSLATLCWVTKWLYLRQISQSYFNKPVGSAGGICVAVSKMEERFLFFLRHSEPISIGFLRVWWTCEGK